MGADQDVAPRLALIVGELAAHYGRAPTSELQGYIRALMLEIWEAGGRAADPTTVPTGRTPLPFPVPPLPRGVTED